MKAVLNETKRILAVMLSVAMIIAAVPQAAFAASENEAPAVEEQAEEASTEAAPVEEEKVLTEATNSNADESGEGLGETSVPGLDDTFKDQREFSLTLNSDINVSYGGTATSTITAEAEATSDPITKILYTIYTPKSTSSAKAVDDASTLSAKLALLEEATLPGGFSHKKNGLVVSIGTLADGAVANEVADHKAYYVLVSDNTGETDTSVNAESKLQKIIINVNEVAPTVAGLSDNSARVSVVNKAITFGAGLPTVDDTTEAKQGYVVTYKKDTGDKRDQVVPVNFKVSSTVGQNVGKTVSCKIEAFNEEDNTKETVTSGDASKNAFTVTPAVSADPVSSGIPALFEVKPSEGLTAQHKSGTTYKAKLVISSDMFKDIEYTLQLKVTTNVAISEVLDNNGFEASGTGADVANAYDLGILEVGETISNVAVTVEGGTGTIGFDTDTSSKIGATDMEALPSGLTVDPSTPKNVWKLSGTIDSGADSYISDNYHYFALTATDGGTQGTQVSTSKAIFKYKVAQADIEMAANKGAYNEAIADEMTVGVNTNTFSWFGTADASTPATLGDDYATVYINNTSDTSLKFIASLTAGTGEFTLEPAAFTGNGCTIEAGQTAALLVKPKTVATNHATANLTIKAAGVKDTVIALDYENVNTLMITRPAEDGGDGNGTGDGHDVTDGNIGPAYVGQNFSYTFDATYPSSVKGVYWSLVSLTDHTDESQAPTTPHKETTYDGAAAVTQLQETYGLTLENGALSGTLKATDTVETNANIHKSLKLVVRASKVKNPISTDQYEERTVYLETKLPEAVEITSGGKKIPASGLRLGKVKLDSVDSAEAEITLTNKTDVEQKGMQANITSVTLSPSATKANNFFRIVYDKDNKTRNDKIAFDGLTLAKNEGTGSFFVSADPANLTPAGEYTAVVTVTGGADVSPQTFTVKLTVEDVPVVTKPTAFTSNYFTVGTAAGTANTYAYSALYATADPAAEWAWTVTDGDVPGLSLDKDTGKFVGTPTTAGEFEVTVTATTTNQAKNVSGSLTHKIVVNGNATLDVTASSLSIATQTYLLTGEATGYTDKDKLSLVVSATSGENKPAKNVTVTVEAAEDDRGATEDLDDNKIPDVVEDKINPYEKNNSADVIEAVWTQKDVSVDKGEALTIRAKEAPAGFYKVKVTVAGDNASPVSFKVALNVTDKLVINNIPNFEGKVGQALEDESLVFTAAGGYADQIINWSETGTDTKFYITDDGVANGTPSGIGLALADEGDHDAVPAKTTKIGAANSLGLKTNVTGTPTKANTTTVPKYTVGVSAKVDGLTANAISGLTELGTLKRILARTTSPTNYPIYNDDAKVVPDQTAETKNFDITIGQNDKVQITNLRLNGVQASSGKLSGTIVGKALGNGYSKITSYTYKPAAVSSPESDSALGVYISGGGVGLGADLALKKGVVKSPFTLSTAKITNTNGVWVTVTPKSTLNTGTFEDTLEITGDDMATVNMDIKFIVEEESFKATIDNDIAPDAVDTSKRVAYVTDMTEGTGTTPVELDVVIAKTAAGDVKTLTVRNTGNSQLNKVIAKEVKKSGNSFVNMPAGEALLAINGDLATEKNIGVGANKSFGVTNSATGIQEKKDTTAYVGITYEDSEGDGHTIVVPVSVLVLNDAVETLSVTGDGAVTVDEGYTYESGKIAYTLTNSYSGEDQAETIKNISATITGTDAGLFRVVTPNDKNVEVPNDLKKGNSFVFEVRAVEGAEAKTSYNATVTFTADNIDANISKPVTFTVVEPDAFVANYVASSPLEIRQQSIATKLYNSIVYGAGTDPRVTVEDVFEDTEDSNKIKQRVDLNLDQSTTEDHVDIAILFEGTGTDGDPKLTTATKAYIWLESTNTLTADDDQRTLALTAVQQTAAGNGLTYNDAKKFFKSITFNPYVTVVFDASNVKPARAAANTDLFEDKSAALIEYHNDIYIPYTDADNTSDTYGQAGGFIQVLIPAGRTIASAFKDGKLPTPIIDNSVFKEWVYGTWSGAGTVPDPYVFTKTSTLPTKALTYDLAGECVPSVDAITYAPDGSKDGDPGVKWAWTDNDENYNAVLTLTDVSGKLDEETAIVVTKDSDTNDPGYTPYISQAVVITDHGSQPATCTKGSRDELLATAKVTFSDGERTYTGTYSKNEKADAKGHVWQDVVVKWTDKNGDGKYTKDEVTASRTCTVCGDVANLTIVAVNETITKEPTCETPGQATYSVTYTDVDKFGRPAGNVTDDKNTKVSEVAKLGHDYKLVVEWAEDHKTASKANLVCQRDKTHVKDVIASATYAIEYNEDGTVAKNTITVVDEGKEYTDTWVDDILYNPQVEWTSDFPLKWYKGTDYPTMTYNVVVSSKKQGKRITISENNAKVTSNPITISGNELQVTFTATADLSKYYTDDSGSTVAKDVTKDETYYFKDGGEEGISDVYYAPEVEWIDKFPAKWTKGTSYPTMTYKVTYTSKRTGEKTTLSGNKATVASNPSTIPSDATTADFIATADLSAYYTDAEGTKPAQNVAITQKYVFPNGQAEGYARDYKYKSHNFTWPTKTEPMATPNVKVKVTYSVTENKKTLPDETISGNAIMSDGTISGNYISFTAKVNTFDGLTKSETKKYNIKTGKLYEGQETPAEPEQPENKTSVNLFYTNADKEIISLQLPDGADVKGGSGKWTTYYDIDESGTVTVKAPAKDLSKAAKPANSVITIPVKSASGNEIGQFSYSLPVYYQKPKLKLTSTSGIVNTAKGGETTLVTTVTEKKSSGAFEKMSLDNLADDGLKYNAKSGSVVIAVGDEVGEITLTTSAKASGKISIQLENWVEPMELSYTVKASNKNVLTSDKKQVIFNLNYYGLTGADEPDSQGIELYVNGEPAEAGALTLVKMPKDWETSGLKLADGCLDESNKITDSTLTFEYSGTKPAKNSTKTYSFQFKAEDNKKITVKAQMSKLALANKALTYKTQTKMNLSTGQRMVLIPQFKGVTGEYEDVKLASGDEKTFELEYDDERGQVYLAPADDVTLSSKTQYTPTIEATVGGVPVTTQLKFKPQQSNVTVKIDKVTVPKTKMEDGTMEAEANVLCTYKQGGKTFTTAPNRQGDTDAVTFMIDNKTKAPAVGGEELGKLGLTDGWYKIDKANVLVKYEASTGTILVRPTGKVVKPKNGSVKVWLNFNGKIVKKTLNVKIDKTK